MKKLVLFIGLWGVQAFGVNPPLDNEGVECVFKAMRGFYSCIQRLKKHHGISSSNIENEFLIALARGTFFDNYNCWYAMTKYMMNLSKGDWSEIPEKALLAYEEALGHSLAPDDKARVIDDVKNFYVRICNMFPSMKWLVCEWNYSPKLFKYIDGAISDIEEDARLVFASMSGDDLIEKMNLEAKYEADFEDIFLLAVAYTAWRAGANEGLSDCKDLLSAMQGYIRGNPGHFDEIPRKALCDLSSAMVSVRWASLYPIEKVYLLEKISDLCRRARAQA